MLGYTERTKRACIALTLCLVVGIILPFGCKKKEPAQGSGREPSTETRKPAPAPERVYQADTGEKINLRVLYAGVPNSERAKDFTDFLAEHFEQVETADYNAFKEGQSTDFDVTILDYDGVNTRAPRPKISRDYAHATITVGVPGAFIGRSLSLKTGYL